MRVTSFLSLALVIVFRPCASDGELSPQSCFSEPIAAWYDGSGLTDAQWTDKSGNGFHASFTNTVPLLFDDADASNELYLNGEPVLYGDTSTKVVFPDELIVGKEHTIFNACKYQEGGKEGRILQSRSINALFGFWSGNAGVAYESGWITAQVDNFGTEWVLSSQSSPFYRANGIDFTIASGGANAIGPLGINSNGESSDWACAEILIINAELSEDEIECVENTYFNCKYGEGFGDGACVSRIEHYGNCGDFNIDGFLTECSADFPAEQEALVAVEVRVSTLEDSVATSESLASTHAAMEAVTADLSAFETATNANLATTDANLAATDVAVGEVSVRVNTIEETLLGLSSAHFAARTATAQFDTLPANTGTSLLLGEKDLLIVISLAVNTVLLMALLAVLCRSGKGYKAVGTFAESDSEMAELQ